MHLHLNFIAVQQINKYEKHILIYIPQKVTIALMAGLQ